MNIEKREDPKGTVTLRLSGRIDTNTSAQLRAAIIEVPVDIGRLVLDFSDVPYITSAGLRELLICRKRYPGEQLRIVNVNTDVMEIFEMTGFDSVLPIESTAAEADTGSEELPSSADISFKELLARHVRLSGTRTVLMDENGGYTWEDIDRASQIIAGDLSRLGVKTGTHVGLCGSNSVNWVMTFYAIQKLGAIAMLMNPGLSVSEIGQVCTLGDIAAKTSCPARWRRRLQPSLPWTTSRCSACPAIFTGKKSQPV